MKKLVIDSNNVDTTASYVAASAAREGSLLVAYIPPAHSGDLTIDLSVMSSDAYVYWFDPTNGIYNVMDDLPINNNGSYTFTTPGKNSVGEDDWVLMISVKKEEF